MKRFIVALMLALVMAAITGGAALAAPKSVAPDALTPPPPPGAECNQTGQYVICQTFFDESVTNEELYYLSCGTVYETTSVHREGIRWYSDGLLVKRFVTEDAEGTLSLSPTGEEPTVRLMVHQNWWDHYAVPGDEDSASTTYHGNGLSVLLPGSGGERVAGIYLPDGTHHGVARDFDANEDNIVDNPEVEAALCDALGGTIPE